MMFVLTFSVISEPDELPFCPAMFDDGVRGDFGGTGSEGEWNQSEGCVKNFWCDFKMISLRDRRRTLIVSATT